MNKLITLAIVAGLAPLAFAGDGNTASATAQSSVTILAPVTVSTNGVALNFGKVVAHAFPTTIGIDGSSHVTTDGNSIVYAGSHNPIAASIPTFSITKDEAATVAVAFTPVFSNSATFVVDPAVQSGAETFAASAGAAYLNKALYGTITIPSQVYGTITGTVTITATYN